MNALKNWGGWIVLTLAVAALVHIGSVWAVPRVIMARAISRLGTVNEIHHGKRPDATARGVVRPSPDLLYSVCPFDLSPAPLHVRASVPRDTYWSVSAFDAATNNFYVRNDSQIRRAVDFYMVGPGTDLTRVPKDARIVKSPSNKGLVLFRTLVDEEDREDDIDADRRKATCAAAPG